MMNPAKLAGQAALLAALTAAAMSPALAQTPTGSTACSVRDVDATMKPAATIEMPAFAASTGMNGTAVVSVALGPDGKPLSAQVVSSTGWRVLDDAATKAVLAQTYTPAISDCQPVTASYQVDVQF
jgi:TonB family protein